MDAMGLSNKKPHTVSTSHSGSFTPNNPDLAKAAGIVSARPCPPQVFPTPTYGTEGTQLQKMEGPFQLG